MKYCSRSKAISALYAGVGQNDTNGVYLSIIVTKPWRYAEFYASAATEGFHMSKTKNGSKPPKAISNGLVTKLHQSLVVAKDLSQQPQSDYVLLTGAGRPVYYAVDGWEANGDVISFFLFANDKKSRGQMVYTCRREGTWALVAREACHVITDADYAKHQVAEAKVLEDFYAELDPKGWEEAQKMAASGGLEVLMGGGGHSHAPRGPVEDGKPVPGQYL